MENSGIKHHAYITLNPIKEHKYSLIWLHGLTGNATSLSAEFLDPTLNVIPENCKVIMPTAPIRKQTSLNNRPVHSWYNSSSFKRQWASFEDFFANYN